MTKIPFVMKGARAAATKPTGRAAHTTLKTLVAFEGDVLDRVNEESITALHQHAPIPFVLLGAVPQRRSAEGVGSSLRTDVRVEQDRPDVDLDW